MAISLLCHHLMVLVTWERNEAHREQERNRAVMWSCHQTQWASTFSRPRGREKAGPPGDLRRKERSQEGEELRGVGQQG